MLFLTSCSLVLGLEDPKARDDGGVPPDDVGPPSDHLVFSPTDFTVAQGQMVRLHVTFVHKDGSTKDVTADPMLMLTSSNDTFATIGGKGQINGGSQPGSATITASYVGAVSATLKATTTTTVCHPVINELMTENSAASDEYVEIYNPCTTMIDVAGWTLDYRGMNSSADAAMIMLGGQMASGTFRVYSGTAYLGVHDDTFAGGTGLGKTDGSVGLRAGAKDTLPIVDSIAYGTVLAANPFTETTAIPAMNVGKTASRQLFDGNDNNNNANDFVISTKMTPGAYNVP